MGDMVERILNHYGTEMTIRGTGGESRVKGFFQPVRSKSLQNLLPVDTPLGEACQGQYIYIGPGNAELSEGDTLEVMGKDYLLRRVEPYYYGEQKLYLWGLCVEKGGADTWGSQS